MHWRLYDACRLVWCCNGRHRERAIGKEIHMLWMLAGILIAMWLLGMVSGYTLGYLIHVLLIIAVVIVLLGVIQGRRPV